MTPDPSAAAPTPTAPTTTQRRSTGRVVVFTGPKEGVGKSQICLNLALAWAGHQQNRSVLIVHLDTLCRQEISYFLNVTPPTIAYLSQAVGKDAQVMAKLFKGRIPISQWGVGVLPLASKRSEVLKLSPDALGLILGSLSESYDLFLDVDPFFPMQMFAFDHADRVFWITLPHRAHLEATYNLFQELKTLHFPLDRFEVVVNEANLPGALAPKEVERFFGALQKRILAYMPWEDLLPEYANLQKILVVESPHSDWVKALRPLLGSIAEAQPSEKTWTGSGLGGAEIAQELLWKPRDGAQPGAAATVSRAAGDLPAFWDELKENVHTSVVTALELERIHVTDSAEQNADLRDKVSMIIENVLQKETKVSLSREQRIAFVGELLDEILGLGPLEELMRDPAINEIMVNGPNRVYLERAGKLLLTNLRFRNEDQIIQVIKRIVAPIGRRIDESVPLVDARLKDGSRVNAIIPPLAVSGPTLTIRRFSAKPYGPAELIQKGSIDKNFLEFLSACVRVKKNVIISGGTGTGKTTFLNCLSGYIAPDERIITVEDTAELKLLQEHWIRLESRPANIEGKGEVTIRDLVRNCLRMRPDRIVVGECRGAEALDMLQAMNTGHEGSLATIHANAPRDALTRMEAMCLMAGADLPIWAVREMISSAVHVIVQLTRFSDGTRRVTAITEITGRNENTILTNDLFHYRQTSVDETGKVHGEFVACGKPPKFYEEFGLKGMKVALETFWTPEQRKQEELRRARAAAAQHG